METRGIISSLGGAAKLGDALRARGVSVQDVTVRSWGLGGRMIPAKYWTHVAAVAKDQGKSVSFEALARQAAA